MTPRWMDAPWVVRECQAALAHWERQWPILEARIRRHREAHWAREAWRASWKEAEW